MTKEQFLAVLMLVVGIGVLVIWGIRYAFKVRKRHRCFICQKGGVLETVQELDMYDCTEYTYHTECITRVLSNPSSHAKFVDRAIVVADVVRENKKRYEDHYQQKLRKANILLQSWQQCQHEAQPDDLPL